MFFPEASGSTSPRTIIGFLIAWFLALGIAPSMVWSLEDGAVITQKNIDQLYDQQFGEHTVGDLLTPYHEEFIRNFGVQMRIQKKYTWKVDEEWKKATKLFAGEASLDESGMLRGWKAGLPFPDVNEGDQRAGLKLAWDYFAGEPKGTFKDQGRVGVMAQDMTTDGGGFNRYQYGSQLMAFMRGLYNLDVENARSEDFIKDQDIYRKLYLIWLYPQSRKGIGVYNIKYFDGRYPDLWAYLRSVRRVRRLSGGSWTDPVPGVTNWAGDDQNVWSGHPLWYPDWEVLGKVTRFVPMCEQLDCRNALMNWEATTLEEKIKTFPINQTGIANWFYDPEDVVFVPRTLWKVKMDMPSIHMYSKRIIYIDADAWYVNYAVTYDKRDDWWKMFSTTRASVVGPDGSRGQLYTNWYGIDLKARWNEGGGTDKVATNPDWISHQDLKLSALRQGQSLRP